MNKISGFLEDRASVMQPNGTASAGVSPHSAAADHVHPTDGLMRIVDVPASKTAAGTKGDIAFDATTLYICVDTNTWKKVAIAWS